MKRISLLLMIVLLLTALSGCENKAKLEKQVLESLAKNSWFYCSDLEVYSKFDAEKKTYSETKAETSYFLEAKITGFEKIQENQYRLTLHVDGFAGNEETDAHDPYDMMMDIRYDLKKPDEYYAGYGRTDMSLVINGHFVSDKGLNSEELIKLLELYGPYADFADFEMLEFNSQDNTVINTDVRSYSKQIETVLDVVSVEYKGMDEYDLHLKNDEHDLMIPMIIDIEEPMSFYCAFENAMYFTQDMELTFEDLIDIFCEDGEYVDDIDEYYCSFNYSDGKMICELEGAGINEKIIFDDCDYGGCNTYKLIGIYSDGSEAEMFVRLYENHAKFAMQYYHGDIVVERFMFKQ